MTQSTSFTTGIHGATQSGMNDATYNRLEVIRLSGAPEDAVRFWIREGLLRGPDLGPRKRLRFDRDEVKIAAFLREARNNGMNVASMRALVGKIRDGLALFNAFDISLEAVDDGLEVRNGVDIAKIEADLISAHNRPEENAAKGIISEESLKRFRQSKYGRLTVDEKVAQVRLAAEQFPHDRRDEWILGMNFSEGEAVLMAWQDVHEQWQTYNGLPQDWRLPAPSVVVFDWEQICLIDWPLSMNREGE